MCDYKDVLKRLVQYRRLLNLTQKQAGQRIGICQEQYSNIENGETIITNKNLKCFNDIGWDIDFIITGRVYDKNDSVPDSIIDAAGNDEERKQLKKLLAWAVLTGIKKQAPVEDVEELNRTTGLLEALMESGENFSMVLYAREQLQLSQITMAEKLGIGIKKYREIEKERRYPDAEMLYILYQMTGYRPTIFMDIHDRTLLCINIIWNMMDKSNRKKILDFVNYAKLIF